MVRKTDRSRQGLTITSVLVAAALAGIIAVIVGQLAGNQAQVMRTLTLREERENLLKHYRNTLISGWDNTLAAGCSSLRDRRNNVAIPSGGIKSRSDNLYSPAGDGWWQVEFNCDSKSGSIFGGDKYETTTGSGMHSETHREVTLTVKFLKDEHPHAAPKLKDRVETFYMHQQRRRKTDATDCTDESNRTRRNYYKPNIDAVPASLWGGATPDTTTGFPLYKGTGAVIQYDFNTNYVKCSQVPLVKPPDDLCKHDAAIIGFWGLMEGGSGYPYLDGRYVCSHDGSSGAVPINPATGVRYHPKVDGYLPERLITVYRGDDGDPRHLGHFGAGCQKDADAKNKTFVSFIDGNGTAFCQRTRHVVEKDIRCDDPYPHPKIPTPHEKYFDGGYKDPVHEDWGQHHNTHDKVYADREIAYEQAVRDAATASGCEAKGWCPPLPVRNSGIFKREKRDTCWKLGRGGMREFYAFDDTRGDPGQFHRAESDGYTCHVPGHEKGGTGGNGNRGGRGTGPRGQFGSSGCIQWSGSTP